MNVADAIAASSASAPSASVATIASSGTPLRLLGSDAADAPTGVGAFNALVLVLVLGALLVWVLRTGRWPGAAGLRRAIGVPASAGLRVLQSNRLTPKASAHVLQWGDEQWLVVCSDHATTVVAHRGGAAAPATEDAS